MTLDFAKTRATRGHVLVFRKTVYSRDRNVLRVPEVTEVRVPVGQDAR